MQLMPRTVLMGFVLAVGCGDGDDDLGGADATPDVSPADASPDSMSDAAQDSSAVPTIGTPHAVMYSASGGIGIDMRPNSTATFDDSGVMTGYEAGAQEKPLLGTLTNSELKVVGSPGDHGVAIGRWSDGNMAGEYYGGTYTFSATQGFHYAVGSTGTLPATGDKTYTVTGSTKVTGDDGNLMLGTVTGTAKATFGSVGRLALELTVAVPGDMNFSVSTAGGLADPSQSGIMLTGASFFGNDVAAVSGGTACATGCKLNLRGLVAGESAELLGLAILLSGDVRMRAAIVLEAD